MLNKISMSYIKNKIYINKNFNKNRKILFIKNNINIFFYKFFVYRQKVYVANMYLYATIIQILQQALIRKCTCIIYLMFFFPKNLN